MIKPSPTTKEAAAITSPSAQSPEELVRSGAESGAFAQMLALAHAQTTAMPKSETLAISETAPETAIGIRFKGAKAQAGTSVGGKSAGMKAQSVHGHEAVKAAIVGDAWEEAKAQHKTALKQIPGLGRSNDEVKAKDHEVRQEELASSTLKQKGVALDGKLVNERADKSPILHDENGTALTVGALDPDSNLGVYLAKEGKNALEDGRVSELLSTQKAKQKMPVDTNDAFVQSSTTHKTAAVAQHAASISESTKDVLLQAAEKTSTQADTPRLEEFQAQKNTSVNPKNEKPEAHRQTFDQEPQSIEKSVQSASEYTTENPSQNDFGNGNKKHNVIGEIGKRAPQAFEAGTLDSTSMLDAGHVAQAIKQNDAPLAAARLAELMGARLELLARGNERTLTVTLTPRELGEIRAQLVTNGETTDLHLKAEKDAVGKSLEMAVPELTRMLQKAGVTVGQVSIDYGLADFGDSRNDQQRFANDGREGSFSPDYETAQATTPHSVKTPAAAKVSRNGGIDVVA